MSLLIYKYYLHTNTTYEKIKIFKHITTKPTLLQPSNIYESISL